jgi:hypothetical protein
MQSSKKFVMFVLVTVLAAALAIVPARAQSRLSANVPFDFVLGKTTLQSGQYRIAMDGSSFVAVTNEQGNLRFSLLLPGSEKPGHDAQPYLEFHRYGDQAFLRKIVFSATEVYELPVSGREKEMRAHLRSGEQVAVLIQPLH